MELMSISTITHTNRSRIDLTLILFSFLAELIFIQIMYLIFICIVRDKNDHFLFQSPPHSGSTFYNYKGNHSINLLAVCDANYCFTLVDIGAEGRQSDSGIFTRSNFGQRFERNQMNLPQPRPIETFGPALPFVLVADEAFALTHYMMRPYPRSGRLNRQKKVIYQIY